MISFAIRADIRRSFEVYTVPPCVVEGSGVDMSEASLTSSTAWPSRTVSTSMPCGPYLASLRKYWCTLLSKIDQQVRNAGRLLPRTAVLYMKNVIHDEVRVVVQLMKYSRQGCLLLL